MTNKNYKERTSNQCTEQHSTGRQSTATSGCLKERKEKNVMLLFCYARYKRVRQLLVDMGLDLPETPKPQPTLTAFGDSSAGVPLDPGKAFRV